MKNCIKTKKGTTVLLTGLVSYDSRATFLLNVFAFLCNMSWSLDLNLAHTFMMKFLDMEIHTNVMESFRALKLGWRAWKNLISNLP